MDESESVTSSLPGPQVVQLVRDLVQLVIELARLTSHKAGATVTRVLKQEEFCLEHFGLVVLQYTTKPSLGQTKAKKILASYASKLSTSF